MNIESDIYAYGIIMFEILTGMEADGQGRAIGDYKEHEMINLVLRFHDDGPKRLIVLFHSSPTPLVTRFSNIESHNTSAVYDKQCMTERLGQKLVAERYINIDKET
ncbi:protein kinase, ATP binding site-containing protein [Tanacetum coccineum]